MKRLFPALLLALAAPLALAQTAAWTPDPNHSEVDFAIRHMGLTLVHGHFGAVAGTLHLDPADPEKSSVQVTINVTGVDTGVDTRDDDLRSSNFFDTDHYPTAAFASTSVQKTADGLAVIGNLTLHGVTKPVTLHVDPPQGPVTGADHKPHMGFSATATLSRAAFAIGASYPDTFLGDDVKITIELEAIRQ